MTQQQLIQEFKNYPREQKSVVIEQLLQIYQEEQNGKEISIEEKNGNSTAFEINSFSLEPKKDFDFDNIGRLISEIEGDFHK